MKTTTICPICNKEFTRVHAVYKIPIYCSRACSNKSANRMTDEIKSKIGNSRHGINHSGYKGGWIAKGSKGTKYFMVPTKYTDIENYPTVNKYGYIPRSHVVWNKNNPNDIVQKGQVIHHVNKNSLDDRIENLKKFQNNSEHVKFHSSEYVEFRDRDDFGRFI